MLCSRPRDSIRPVEGQRPTCRTYMYYTPLYAENTLMEHCSEMSSFPGIFIFVLDPDKVNLSSAEVGSALT